jgi:hypothetical protein
LADASVVAVPHSLVPPRPAEAVQAVLEAKGFVLEDFELDEYAASPSDEWLGVEGRVLRIRCVSTGEERIYSTGAASAWLGAFLMDLGRGDFDAALRVDDQIAEPDATRGIDDSTGLLPALA